MFNRPAIATLALVSTFPALAAELPDFAGLVERSAPAIVEISTRRADPRPNLENWLEEFDDLLRGRNPSDDGPAESPRTVPTVGSGFIISADGYLLTNNHVVAGAAEIRAQLNDRRVFPAEVIGLDEPSDLALLKIEAEDLPFVGFGDSDALRIGDWVLAIGSPFGLEFSASAGIVSAKGRTVPRRSSYNYMAFLQTDVAINQGNSGGPLFNLAGEVIGINSRILSSTGGSNGVSFAIPSNVAVNVLEQLRRTGAVQRGLLGVQMREVDYDLALSFGMERPRGALIEQVLPASPAQRAGLRDGDIVLDFNGHEIDYYTELPFFVGQYRPGVEADIVVRRDGERRSFQVVLGSSPTNTAAAAAERPSRPVQRANPLGFQVVELSEETRQITKIGGVRVAALAPGPGSESGLRLNDVITALGGAEVESVADFVRIAESLPRVGSVPMGIMRRGENLELMLRLP